MKRKIAPTGDFKCTRFSLKTLVLLANGHLLARWNADVVLSETLLHGARCNVLQHVEFLNRVGSKLAGIHTRCNSTTPCQRKALCSLVSRLEIALHIGGYRLVVRVVRLLQELLGNDLQRALAVVVARAIVVVALLVDRLLLVVATGLGVDHLLSLDLLIAWGLHHDTAQPNGSAGNRSRFGIARYRRRDRPRRVGDIALAVVQATFVGHHIGNLLRRVQNPILLGLRFQRTIQIAAGQLRMRSPRHHGHAHDGRHGGSCPQTMGNTSHVLSNVGQMATDFFSKAGQHRHGGTIVGSVVKGRKAHMYLRVFLIVA